MLDHGTTDMYAQVLFGQHTRRAPSWMYVQNMGPGLVSFVGASRIDADQPHPFRFGSDRTHQFLVGETIIRPTRLIVATDALRGHGAGNFLISDHNVAEMLAGGAGEILLARA